MRHAIRTTKLSANRTESCVLSFYTAAERAEYLSTATNPQNVRAATYAEVRSLRLGEMVRTGAGIFVRQVL